MYSELVNELVFAVLLHAGDHLEDVIDFYGPVFNLPIMYTDLYMTASPEHVKSMLVTDFPNYVKGTSLKRI